MNRYLLAGCAAAALAMGAGAANAQAKFEIKLGGDAYFEGGYVDQDLDNGLRSTEFRNRFRLNVTPTAKADNGLEYGARARIRANSGAGTLDADRGYIFVQGGFGQVQLGVTNSFNDNTYVSRPIDYEYLGIYDAFMNYITGSNNTASALVGRDGRTDVGGAINGTNTLTAHSITANANATKIVYYSPSFSGFQAGLSYTPRTDSNLTDVKRTKEGTSAVISTTAGSVTAADTSAALGYGNWSQLFQDVVEIGANYKNTFGGVGVAVGGGYFWGKAETTGGVSFKDLNAFQLGAKVSYAGFTLGGGFVSHGESGQAKTAGLFRDKNEVWNVGLQYATGPILVGAAYTNGKDPGSLSVRGERKLQTWGLGASYTVAPGLNVGAEYTYFDSESDLSTSAVDYDDKGSVILLRSVVAF